MKPVSVISLQDMKQRGEKIAMLTAYDASFAHAAATAGVDSLLVGDSLGMVCQGAESTLGVTVAEMAYHTRSVCAGVSKAALRPLVVADLPFGAYPTKAVAIDSAATLVRAGAQMVKLEGGGWVAEVVAFIVERGIPVCAHLGLTPQRVHALGGHRVQGRTAPQAEQLSRDAQLLQAAGATLIVLEMVPASLAAEVTRSLASSATIGIGAGLATDGQVLVLHDMLGLAMGRAPRFVANFLQGADGIGQALANYVAAVKSARFPVDAQHAW